jgi:PIN domain nuclease of toxin-antitoxin system
MSLVFDAGALVAMIKNEPGAALVEQRLLDNPGDCYAHAVNLCEVYYPILRTDGVDEAQQVLSDLSAAGIQEREDMDAAFWQSAAGYKSAYHMSLADAFCVALANRMGAELITSDRHELEPLLADGVARITFIR